MTILRRNKGDWSLNVPLNRINMVSETSNGKFYIVPLSGAWAGFTTRLALQPLDVIKIRFQLQVEPIQRNNVTSKYRSIAQAFKTMITEEGINALWKGHVAAQVLSITYNTLQFSVFDSLSKSPTLQSYLGSPQLVNLVGGASAGCAATLISYPVDVLRTRFIGQAEPRYYKTYWFAIRSMWQTEGPRAFFLGLTPTLLLTSIQTSIQFATYHLLMKVKHPFLESHESLRSFMCGALAGTCGKLVSYPLEVVKKRQQVLGEEYLEGARLRFGRPHRERRLRRSLVAIWRAEGAARGLYKGLAPSLLKASLVSGFTFASYNLYLRALTDLHPNPNHNNNINQHARGSNR